MARCTTPDCTDTTPLVSVRRSVQVSMQYASYGVVLPTAHYFRVEHASGVVHDDGSFEVHRLSPSWPVH